MECCRRSGQTSYHFKSDMPVTSFNSTGVYRRARAPPMNNYVYVEKGNVCNNENTNKYQKSHDDQHTLA